MPEEFFNYDPLGNLTGNRVSGAAAANQVFANARPHAISAKDGGLSYEYDGDGNLLSETSPSGPRHFSFDSQSRLVCVGPVAGSCSTLEVDYDAEGSRVRDRYLNASGAYIDRFYADELFTRTIGGESNFHIFALGKQIAFKRRTPTTLRTAAVFGLPWSLPGWPTSFGVVLLGSLGMAGLAILALRLTSAGEEPALAAVALALAVVIAVPPLPARAGGGGSGVTWRRWLLADGLGSTNVVVAADGSMERETLYAPFGAIHQDVGTDSTGSTIFAGHRRDAATGLHYMRARWQDPTTGSFLSVDPVVARVSDPQSYNAYAYAGSNPISNSDPSGMSNRPWQWQPQPGSAITGLKLYSPLSGGQTGRESVPVWIGAEELGSQSPQSQGGLADSGEGGGRAVDYNRPDRGPHELPLSERTGANQHELNAIFGKWVETQDFGLRSRGEFVTRASPLPDNTGWVMDEPRWFRGHAFDFGNTLNVSPSGYLLHSHPTSSRKLGVSNSMPSGSDLRTAGAGNRVDVVVYGREYRFYTRGFDGRDYVSGPVRY